MLSTATLIVAAIALCCSTYAYVPFPNPPQRLPTFKPSYDMFDSSIIMPCNYTGPFSTKVASEWGISDIDWSNSKAQWVQKHPMQSQEELVNAASNIRAVSNRTKVWVYRNLAWAPSWFTDVREKIISNPEWFIKFKKSPPYNNTKCTFNKCSDLFHSQFQTPEYQSGSVESGSCTEHCDCGDDVPCGWYLWNHSHPGCRKWLVEEHMMGNTAMGNDNIQGIFIDDVWDENGPELEGPGSEFAVHDTGMSQEDVNTMQIEWRKTMDAANNAVIEAGGYTWRLFYNNWTCANAPFKKNECKEYMDVACSKEAPLEKNALFYGFSGMTGCSPGDDDYNENDNQTTSTKANVKLKSMEDVASYFKSGKDPIIDKMQHLASFLLIRGPYAWLGWSWLGCGNFPFRPKELDIDYGIPLETCHPSANETGVYLREYTKSSIRVDCNKWEGTISMK